MEKDLDTNEIFGKYCYDEVYYRNNKQYYKLSKNGNLIKIKNPYRKPLKHDDIIF